MESPTEMTLDVGAAVSSVGTIRVKRPAGFKKQRQSGFDFQIECLFVGVAYSENRAQGTLTTNEAQELSCGHNRILEFEQIFCLGLCVPKT